MAIPDLATCLQLMDAYGMLDNIRRHSLVVARVADLLVCELSAGASTVSVPRRSLVLAGALLHDIAKTPCLDGSCDHATHGAAICRQHGYPEVAAIVEEHVILNDHDSNRRRAGRFTAREIVYYADKRVRHEEIVSLEDRLDYIIRYYGKGDPQLHRLIRENFILCQQLEEDLFSFLPFAPHDLEKEVRFPRLNPDLEDDPWL